jgi:hypothetical protein
MAGAWYHECVPSARDSRVVLSGQRRFVPRASTRLTTRLHLSVQEIAEHAVGRRGGLTRCGLARCGPSGCGRSGDRPYKGCAKPSTQWAGAVWADAVGWRGVGHPGVGALGIAPTRVARSLRRSGLARWAGAVWAGAGGYAHS